ncbi:MAG: NIPSNAP family protein [Gemmatimonadetes bacterium]|nr:NIPSNAP family protein [Gemmatimonadota bacterium]
MATKRVLLTAAMVALFGAGYALGRLGPVPEAEASPLASLEAADRVFELRTYTAPEGKLDDLLARFRNHTMRIFERHGMTNVGYWLPQDTALRSNTLVYLLAHPSRAAADQAWRDFAADPEWQRVSEESQRDGRIVTQVVRQYLDPTDFSQMK